VPVRTDLKSLYGPDWREVSDRVRFDRAGGRCENCGRPHGSVVFVLSGGGWIDPATGEAWLAGIPLERLALSGMTRVVLATAHRDHDPTNRDDANLAAWCQRCHMLFDAPHHWSQRRITLRVRYALADLFDGPYGLAGYPRNAP
jgi:hypothetical protein